MVCGMPYMDGHYSGVPRLMGVACLVACQREKGEDRGGELCHLLKLKDERFWRRFLDSRERMGRQWQERYPTIDKPDKPDIHDKSKKTVSRWD